MIAKDIDTIVWWIPFKKTRDSLRRLLDYITTPPPPNIQMGIAPIGFYESPYPAAEELVRNYAIMDWKKKTLEGVNLNTENQLQFYKSIENILLDFYLLKDDEKNNRLHHNMWFGNGCALHLMAIIRHLKPKRIIEIGSGYSTCVMLDINRMYFNNEIEITCIEPDIQRLYGLLTDEEKNNLTIIEGMQQDVDIKVFSKLEKNDLLFIDSSHVSRPFSDVNRQFFGILPSLNKNVYIHFHDIFHPFEYPKAWTLDQRRAYNEAYILRAFLQYNDCFDIFLHAHYLHNVYSDKINEKILKIGSGGGIYLKKIK